jgi:hypothetical protein
LKHTKEFSEEEIANFVNKISGGNNDIDMSPSAIKVESLWTYQDMVSAIVERVQLCNKEILLASRYLNEIIINSILRKANSSRVNVKVLTDTNLVKQYFETEDLTLKLNLDNVKNATERMNVVSNPWYPGRVDRKICKIPFSIIILDGKEVGIEIVNWNDPRNFYGVMFVKGDPSTLKVMQDLYYEMWDNASPSCDYDRLETDMLSSSENDNNRLHKIQ